MLANFTKRKKNDLLKVNDSFDCRFQKLELFKPECDFIRNMQALSQNRPAHCKENWSLYSLGRIV